MLTDLMHFQNGSLGLEVYESGGGGTPGGTYSWSPIGTTMPTGAAAAAAAWQFDGTGDALTDRTGNGCDLVLNAGTLYYLNMHGIVGFSTQVAQLISANPAPASLRLTGAITIETIAAICVLPAGNYLLGCGGLNTELEAGNMLYTVWFGSSGNDIHLEWERLAGQDQNASVAIIPPLHSLFHLVVTRAADGVTVNFYVNGVLVGTDAGGGIATGGTTARLRIGMSWDEGTTNYGAIEGLMCSLRISPNTFTAAQVLEAYNAVWSAS